MSRSAGLAQAQRRSNQDGNGTMDRLPQGKEDQPRCRTRASLAERGPATVDMRSGVGQRSEHMDYGRQHYRILWILAVRSDRKGRSPAGIERRRPEDEDDKGTRHRRRPYRDSALEERVSGLEGHWWPRGSTGDRRLCSGEHS